MEPMEIRIWNSKVNMLEKTEEIIARRGNARHQQTTFYEGLSLFFAEGYVMAHPTENISGMLSQQVA